jgi:hypothetical protein
MIAEAGAEFLWGFQQMISALVVARLAFQPMSRELQVTCIWAAAGLVMFGMMAHLGFAAEIGDYLALE